jgi:hypothetical protein
MAAGTSSYFLAFSGTLIFSLIAYVLSLTNYGARYKSEFILRFSIDKEAGEPAYSPIIDTFAKSATLLHVEPSGDNLTARLTFDILMRKDADSIGFSNEISGINGVSEVRLIASKTDIDY